MHRLSHISTTEAQRTCDRCVAKIDLTAARRLKQLEEKAKAEKERGLMMRIMRSSLHVQI